MGGDDIRVPKSRGSAAKPPSQFQKVIQMSNDIDSLIPLGTLNFFNLPVDEISLSGVGVRSSRSSRAEEYAGWKWADLDFLIHHLGSRPIHPIVADLHFLAQFRFITMAYNTFKVRCGPKKTAKMSIVKLRLYGVPTDISGSHDAAEWRNVKPKNLRIQPNYCIKWSRLIDVLDYSNEGWYLPPSGITLTQLCNKGLLLVPFIVPTPINNKARPGERRKASKFHLERWVAGRQYSPDTNKDSNKPESASTRLQAVYNNIVSPQFSEYNIDSSSSAPVSNQKIPSAEETLLELLKQAKSNNVSIDGVLTQLYPFQIKSLSKMFEKESSTTRALIPTMIKLTSPTLDRVYYCDVLNYGFCTEPELYLLPKGGILGESMGVGKTLISLSLVCLTKFEVSTIPEDMLLYDDDDEDVSVLYPDQQKEVFSQPLEQPIESLVDICKKTINQNSLPWKFYLDDLPSSVINKLSQSPGSFRIPIKNYEYQSAFHLKSRMPSTRWRQTDHNAPAEGNVFRTLYLCNTTLIIVPDNIFHQWNNELKKHIDPDFLKKLFISTHFDKHVSSRTDTYTSSISPDPKDLLKFDLVLITSSFLTRQLSNSRSIESPLNNVYWKRLIIDEGHTIGTNSRTSDLCTNLFAERRWAVSGTPTSGLTRLDMDEETDQLAYSSPSKKKYTVTKNYSEKVDLTKLGNIVGKFLKIEPFFSQQKSWGELITKPFLNDLYGSTLSLTNLLNSIMVRHALNDIDQDLKLPQLHHEAVFLEPSFHNKLSINLFTAVLAANAVSSERTDIDYMFHPVNRQQLRRLVTNLQRATFHWTGFQQGDVEGLIHVCHHSLKKRRANGKSWYSDYDLRLVQDSLEASKRALSNPRWRTSSLLHEMNYYLSGLPDSFTKSFGTGVLQIANSQGLHDDVGVFGAPHIHTMQEFFFKNRFLDINDSDSIKERLEKVAKPFWSTYWNNTVKRNSQKFNRQDTNQNLNTSIKSEEVMNAIEIPDIVEGFKPTNSVVSTPKRRNSIQSQEGFHAKDELTRQDGEGLKLTDELKTSVSQKNKTHKSIKQARILGTASAKLSYLASRLLEHQDEKVKSIVFFEFEDSAYYLTELLDLMGVSYILYATFIKPTERTNNLAEFSKHSSETNGGIALIMDLRLASHGLTIIAATRVYFISPIWERSIEAQAIKRAHRIGQTKDVYVETLVLSGTLEEEIYKRRSEDTTVQREKEEADKQKAFVIDDSGMQDFILKHKFLKHRDDELEYSPFFAPAIRKEPICPPSSENDDLDYSLLRHQDILHQSDTPVPLREWIVYVFSKECLFRSNSIKATKSTKRKLEDEFLHEFTETNENCDDKGQETGRLSSPKKVNRAKKVRF